MGSAGQNNYNICVLISGRGSNLKSLVQQAAEYVVIAVVSNTLEAPGLAFAAAHGIRCVALARRDYPSLEAHKQAIYQAVGEFQPALIALAGFMQIVSPEFVDEYYGRIINIHPSLLPKFPGLDTHQRALAAHEKLHGCTVHFVDRSVDSGPIIAQAPVPVLANDTAAALAARVLEREHEIYPWVVNHLARGNCLLKDGVVQRSRAMLTEAESNHYLIPNR